MKKDENRNAAKDSKLIKMKEFNLSMLKGIGNRINRDHLAILKDMQARQRLANIMPLYFPYSYQTLTHIDIELIVNSLLYSGAKRILECGSGLSTLVMGKVLGDEEGREIICLEQDQPWIDLMNQLIRQNGLSGISLVKASLLPRNEEGWNGVWYEYDERLLSVGNGFDAVLVDGPPADAKNAPYSRYFSKDLINRFLKPGGFVYLDDTNRVAEQDFLSGWMEACGLVPGKSSEWGRGQIFFKNR